ncbi:Uncharacterised protein [Serratia quinivorans]|jgi:hypothetical protein|nr:Uncharacterised protein [Serratia quinivorans]CAI1187444.1 Uncharacterised protein [Serratia quinivorans]CAI1196241.1 Uncharacterised protein [Serratia quinivorans]CAI1218392.1 Uncharacterised protein [Serratia quinivorans]CAI1914252.1 Uncharacterised protein [Serratia quinivorans]
MAKKKPLSLSRIPIRQKSWQYKNAQQNHNHATYKLAYRSRLLMYFLSTLQKEAERRVVGFIVAVIAQRL